AQPLRDAAWRRDRQGLAQRGGARIARSLPLLQRMQERLPGQCRHGDLQGRVHGASLCRPAAAAAYVQHGTHLLVGASRLGRARRRQFPDACRALRRALEAHRPDRARARHPALRRGNLARLVPPSKPPARPRGAVATPYRGRVMLWPDTFTNFLIPGPGQAAVEVLEAAGYEVVMPTRPLCCGRPLYAAGMLPTAKKLWRQILDSLAPAIREGVPLVGVEPSCVAAFRDELVNLFPKDEDARRLAKQTFMLSEFLVKEGYEPPRLSRKALVHFHCNHHAVMGKEAENTLLKKLGLDFHDLNAGCCGMAGPFGFEDEHYALSVQCGERVLLPAVREASRDTLIIADGFSCREQIAQETNREALNVAQVLRLALREDGAIPPEVEPAARPASAVSARTATTVACGLGAGLIAGSWWLSTHRRS